MRGSCFFSKLFLALGICLIVLAIGGITDKAEACFLCSTAAGTCATALPPPAGLGCILACTPAGIGCYNQFTGGVCVCAINRLGTGCLCK